jgi:hypothetical protein
MKVHELLSKLKNADPDHEVKIVIGEGIEEGPPLDVREPEVGETVVLRPRI